MTSRHSRKRISTGISVAGLLAATIGMADISVKDGNIDKASDPGVKEDTEQGSLGTNKIVLQNLSHTELVKHLANEDYFTREAASKLIWRRGKLVLKALEQAVLSSNPELKSRAKELIIYVKVGISPDTPPHIAKLVQSFDSAETNIKKDILRQLYAEKAYVQMLFMLAEMEDQNLATTLYDNFSRLAHRAARISLGKGDTEAAIEQLKLAPKNEESMRSLAFLYAQTGRLNEELDRLKQKGDDLIDKKWERHLHLEQTNRADIRKFAKLESISGVTANLDLLEGDPTMMHEYYAKRAPLEAKTGLTILKAQYEGDNGEFIQEAHIQQQQILELHKDKKPNDQVSQTMKSMCLTGAGHLVEPYLASNHIYKAFSHIDRREQPKKALGVLGITDAESLQKFIKENTRLALEEIEIDQEDKHEFRGKEKISYADRLTIVAQFYYRKGQRETAKAIISPYLKKLQAQENNEWYKVVESVANQRMHDLAIELVLDRGDDDNTYEQMVAYLYDDTIDTDRIWSALLKRDNTTAEKSFLDIAIIMGVFQAEIKKYKELQNALIKTAAREGVVSLKSMRNSLLSVAMYRQDSISAKRFSKELLDAEDDKKVIPLKKLQYLRELSNSLDWKGIVDLLDEDSSILRNLPRWTAIYSIAKRKLGDLEAADKLLKHAKILSIGIEEDLRDIAIEHYFAGYYDISTEIIERILIISSVDRESHLYKFALSYLSASDNAYTNTQQWGKAAAFFMVKSADDLVEPPSDTESSKIGYYINDFYNTRFTRGIELYQAGEKANGLEILASAHKAIIGNGTLADHFYPAIKATDLDKQYDLWVEESRQHLQRSIEEFPECANTHNSLAWILSRAVRKLDTGILHSEKALRLTPFEASYIDTMAELYHAKGDRKKSVKWGEKAVIASKYGRLDTLGMTSSAKIRTQSLSNQLERFKTEAHPQP